MGGDDFIPIFFPAIKRGHISKPGQIDYGCIAVHGFCIFVIIIALPFLFGGIDFNFCGGKTGISNDNVNPPFTVNDKFFDDIRMGK